MVSGYSTLTSIPRIDGLSTGPLGFGVLHCNCAIQDHTMLVGFFIFIFIVIVILFFLC